jgi:hypothetical protein
VPPPKKVKQTDAIFANVKEVHQQAESEEHTLRLSLDSKATVLIGPFSRGGQSRTGTKGSDHDFKPEGKLTPFGIFRPQTSESDLFFTDSKVSSDFMADALEQCKTVLDCESVTGTFRVTSTDSHFTPWSQCWQA